MDRPRIALLSCGEEVYPRQWLDAVINEVKAGVENLNVNIAAFRTIMNGADGAGARQALKGGDFDLIVVHLVSWHITSYVVEAIRDFKDTPILVWSTGGRTDKTGKLHSPAAIAGMTALLPALKEMGFQYKAVYEKPDEPHKFNEVGQYAKVAQAYRKVRNSRIGLVGYADMGLYTCAYDRTALAARLGIDVEDYFSYEIGQLMDEAPAEAIAGIILEMKNRIAFENEASDKVLDKIARLYYVLKNKASGRGLNAISIKCVTGVTRFMGVNPCMAQSMLAGSDLSVICECDAHGLITNVMLSALTGATSVFMEHYEFFDNEVLVGTCGFLPFDFADGPVKARSANLGDFFVGLSNVSRVKTGTVTVARLFKSGERYKMFLTRAEAKTPPKWIELGWDEPTPDFPSLLLKLDMPVQRYLETVPGQHVILAFGDHVRQMKELCELMDIETVGG